MDGMVAAVPFEDITLEVLQHGGERRVFRIDFRAVEVDGHDWAPWLKNHMRNCQATTRSRREAGGSRTGGAAARRRQNGEPGHLCSAELCSTTSGRCASRAGAARNTGRARPAAICFANNCGMSHLQSIVSDRDVLLERNPGPA